MLRRMIDRILGCADRSWAVVGEAIDILPIEVVEEQSVALQGFSESTHKLLREDLGLEAGRRPRIVAVVEGPGSGPGGLKFRFRRDIHGYSSFTLSPT